jgi:hypothetical protein
MASRHRRQPSRALPLDFTVADVADDEPVAAAKGTASTRAAAGGRSDAAGGAAKAGQEGQGKKLPPATGGPQTSTPEGAVKAPCDGNGTGR